LFCFLHTNRWEQQSWFCFKIHSSLDQRDQCAFKWLWRHHRKSKIVCFIVKDNRENHTVLWGIVTCRWQAFSRIKYSRKIKISSTIFLMYRRLGSVALCSRTVWPCSLYTCGSVHKDGSDPLLGCHPCPGWPGLSKQWLPVSVKCDITESHTLCPWM
jgi:hypothetical protein